MIKKRTRPQGRVRLPSPELDGESSARNQEQETSDASLPLADLLELRKLRKTRQGIESSKLIVGDAKKRRRRGDEDEYAEQEPGGLRAGAAAPGTPTHEDDDPYQTGKDAQARKSVRSNNFTQQTNALDVDKHMMAYIEENMQKKRTGTQASERVQGPADPFAELHAMTQRFKQPNAPQEEGSVAGSLSMLTAIPEVDLGMDTRMKNIEDTERAKAEVHDQLSDRRLTNNDGAPPRFYLGNSRPKSTADIVRDAQREALGLPPADDAPRHTNHNQMATDELVMERFKKRMRK